jgi:hypothetical protein
MIRCVTRKVDGGFEPGIATWRVLPSNRMEDFYTWHGKAYATLDDALKIGNAEIAARVPVDRHGYVLSDKQIGWLATSRKNEVKPPAKPLRRSR